MLNPADSVNVAADPVTGGASLSALSARMEEALAQRRALHRYRRRKQIDGAHAVEMQVDGRPCINFCSNDYLGLAADPRPAEAAAKAMSRCGVGSGASALISGYNAEHQALEEALASFLGCERVLLFSSGWAANLGVLRALLKRGDRLLADELNHASLIDGGRLSGADYHRIQHADVGEYSAAMPASADEGVTLVATDAVFSMDGDFAPLAELSALCRSNGASLMIDDAHGFGMIGETGRGSMERFGVQPDVYVATLGKALGCAGAFVAGSARLIEYLIQAARPWIFSTAPPPAIAAAARRALEILRAEPQRRARLQHNVRRFGEGAAQLGLPLKASATAIQPLMVGDDAAVMRLSEKLMAQGYWVAGIRPPTVPAGTARLRITLSAAHTDAQIDGLLQALSDQLQVAA